MEISSHVPRKAGETKGKLSPQLLQAALIKSHKLAIT